MANEKQLTVNKPQHAIITSSKPRNLSQMGQGGGKTFTMGVLSWMFVQHCPKTLGLIAANTYGQLSDSTLKEIFDVWKKYFGWTEYTRNNPEGYFVIDKQPPECFEDHQYTFTSNSNKIFLRNGTVIMTASLDNYKNIEGRTIGWAMLDETVDTRSEAVKEVITGRLREETIALNKKADKDEFKFIDADHDNAGQVINPLFIFTKPAKEQWLNEFFELEKFRDEIKSSIFSDTTFFEKETETRKIVIASGFFNSRNLPPNYFSDRIAELSEDLIGMLIYGSPFGKSGAEYYMSFSHEGNVKPCKYKANLPLHLTFDFNVNPYMTGQVWQVEEFQDYTEIRCIKEYALSTPRNTIEDVCQQFIEDYGHLCTAGLYYYGDASGKNRQPSKTIKSYFQIVERELKGYIGMNSRRLLKSNPRHRSVSKGSLGRREFMNGILKGKKDIRIYVDPSCKKTIADLEFIKEDANGAKMKEKATINGIVCEKYGHMGDAMDAIVCYLFGDYNRE